MIKDLEPDLVEVLTQIFNEAGSPEIRILNSSQMDLGKLPDVSLETPTIILSKVAIEFDSESQSGVVNAAVECLLKVVAPKGILNSILDILTKRLLFSRLITRSKFKVTPVSVNFNVQAPSAQFRSADYVISLMREFRTDPIVTEKVAYPFLASQDPA
jgi:hypothetical protein